MEAMDANRIIIAANVLGMWLIFVALHAFYTTVWRRHRYDCVRYKLCALRDEVHRMAYIEGKLRQGAFLHDYLLYEINAVTENAETFLFLDLLFDPVSEEAKSACQLHTRLRSELAALSDEEVVLQIERIRTETLSCARKLWHMNSLFFRMRGWKFSAAQIFTAILVKVQNAA